jgi:hypothetical protein
MPSPSAAAPDQRSSATAAGGGVHGEFGVIRSPRVPHAERRRAGVCSLTRANLAAGYADCARLVEWPDKTGWQKLDGSQRGQVQPALIRQDPVLVRSSSGERPWPPGFLGCRKAAGPIRSCATNLRFACPFGSWLQGRGVNPHWGRGDETVEDVLRDE